MAQDPERPIERLLRETAEDRGKQAGKPLELHGANRRLLHDEVARCFEGGASKKGWLRFFSAPVWPRLAWASGLTALLMLAIWMLTPGTPRVSQLAMKEEKFVPPSEVSRQQVSPSAAGDLSDERSLENLRQPTANTPHEPISPPALALGKNLPAPERVPARRQLGMLDASRSGGALRMQTEAGRLEQKEGAPATESAVASSLFKTPETTATAPSLGTKNLAFDGILSTAETQSLNTNMTGSTSITTGEPFFAGQGVSGFSAVAPGSAGKVSNSMKDKFDVQSEFPRKGLPTQVLAKFRIHQEGRQVRVTDQDGSVYTGTVRDDSTETDNAARKSEIMSKAVAPGTRSAGTAGQTQENLFFDVSGTNRNSEQLVRFSGQILGVQFPVDQWYSIVPTVAERPDQGTNRIPKVIGVIETDGIRTSIQAAESQK